MIAYALDALFTLIAYGICVTVLPWAVLIGARSLLEAHRRGMGRVRGDAGEALVSALLIGLVTSSLALLWLFQLPAAT